MKMLNLVRLFLTLGVIIGPLPNTIVNGQTIDAVPVMADLNWIVAQVNANAVQNSGNVSFGSISATGAISTSLATNATSDITGSIITAGGVGVAQDVWIGGLVNAAGGITAGGVFTSNTASTQPFTANGATTGVSLISLTNTGGTSYFGQGSSPASVITGATAYDTLIRGPSGIAFSANAGAGMQMRVSSTGVAVTGTLGASGNFAVATNKFQVTASSGDTQIAGQCIVTGVTLLGGGATTFGSLTAFTDYTGASAGTLTNAPTVGNPTKWIRILDFGTARYIPCWGP